MNPVCSFSLSGQLNFYDMFSSMLDEVDIRVTAFVSDVKSLLHLLVELFHEDSSFIKINY